MMTIGAMVEGSSSGSRGKSQVKRYTYSSRILTTTNAYEIGRQLGIGSFGVVNEARCCDSDEVVAIKKVLQDPRYKNRELDTMKQLYHPNIVALKDFYFSESGSGEDPPQRYLSVVMEFVPENAYKVVKGYTKSGQLLPIILVQLYAYQMIRSLGYLHSLGICHRDVKPQNLLVDPSTHALKLCDFGSAKRLFPGECSVSYICSRFYRAPELMLGATEYTCAIDTWSMGCVIAELITGRPLFAGETSVDQLVKIIQLLGAPTHQQMAEMNRQYVDFQFPAFKAKELQQVIPNTDNRIPPTAYDLLSKMLMFVPTERIPPFEVSSKK